jgi:hypothetical protein
MEQRLYGLDRHDSVTGQSGVRGFHDGLGNSSGLLPGCEDFDPYVADQDGRWR